MLRRIHCANRPGTFTHDIADARDHALIADEPVEAGGGDLGMSPFELVASGLAACTSITILIYARRKGLPIDDLAIEVDYVRATEASQNPFGPDRATRRIQVAGALDAAALQQIGRAARACPVHKLLERGGVQIEDIVEHDTGAARS